MGRLRVASVFAFLFSSVVYAYVPTITASGVPVRWKGAFKLDLVGNSANQAGLSESDVFNSVVHGLERWNQASGGMVKFDYWQGTDTGVYESNSSFNGLSSLYFTSNEQGGNSLSPSVLGLTQVWYDTTTGQIIETDIALNDVNFHFTTNPQDTSGYGSGSGSSAGSNNPNVFVENVITHELGHAFGLSHSGGLQSTMLYMESPEQAHVGCDEAVAIHALYPAGDAGQRGGISGKVNDEGGRPIFGAHVLAISRRRGVVLATALTDRNGDYSLSALEPGVYFLMTEPFFAGSAPLPAYYSDLRNTACPGEKPFGRSALTEASGFRLQAISVGAGQNTGAPPIIARCSDSSGASIVSAPGAQLATSAPFVFDGIRDGNGFGAVDKFSSSQTNYYQLKSLSGDVEIHVLAYSLYSPIHAEVELLDSSGNPVDAKIFSKAYEGDSGYVNYDSYLTANHLAPGDYSVRVSQSSLSTNLFPAGPVSVDSQAFLVLTGSVNEPTPSLAGAIPVNGRCRSQENFSEYQSPSGPPPRHSTSPANGGGVGFCGSVQSSSEDRGADPRAIAGWFVPWVLMLLMAKVLSRSAKLASGRTQD